MVTGLAVSPRVRHPAWAAPHTPASGPHTWAVTLKEGWDSCDSPRAAAPEHSIGHTCPQSETRAQASSPPLQVDSQGAMGSHR